MIYILLQVAYGVCLLLTCAVTWLRGQQPERFGAAVLLVGSVTTVVAESLPGLRVGAAQLGILAVDLLVLAGFLALVLKTNRFWPLWVSGFHLVGVATHLATLCYPSILPQAYVLVQGLWAYPIMVAIVVGTLREVSAKTIARA